MNGDDLLALKNMHPRQAKDLLGQGIVRRFHGDEAARAASEEFAHVHTHGKLPTEMPEISIPCEDLTDGKIGILNLVKRAGLASSNSEARRLVQQGAVRLDDERITDPQCFLELSGESILRCGRRGFARILT